MTTALATLTGNLAKQFNMGDGSDLVNTLKQTCFKGDTPVTDAQMTALLIVAQQYNLNPFIKEIFAFPDKGGIVPVVGVDGWARIINSHPEFDGIDFEQDADSCTCIIHRKDRAHPTRVTEYMAECKRANMKPWQSHPYRMLRHKALIQCARLAFGFVGIYDQDEAERITEVKTSAPAVPIEDPIDVEPFILEALGTRTDEDAAAYWKAHNAKFAKQPADHAMLKQTIIDHRMALKEPQDMNTGEADEGAPF